MLETTSRPEPTSEPTDRSPHEQRPPENRTRREAPLLYDMARSLGRIEGTLALMVPALQEVKEDVAALRDQQVVMKTTAAASEQRQDDAIQALRVQRPSIRRWGYVPAVGSLVALAEKLWPAHWWPHRQP